MFVQGLFSPPSLAPFLMKKPEQNPARWNVHSEASEPVASPSSESILEFALSGASARESPVAPSDVEKEVIELFDELRSGLLRYVFSFGLAMADGEEIIQEAFLALFQHLQQGRSRHNLRGWLFRVAHNLALKKLSRDGRGRSVFDPTAIDVEIHQDPAPGPEEQLAFGQRQTRLLAVLQALPAQDQRCLRLRAEGLRYREIADVLGMSLGSVSASLARSLARLSRADRR
jgi:RNA polymerase sigma-70 factor (ECF subfamily)